MMKKTKMTATVVLALCLMMCLAQVSEAEPMGTAITYQGRLMDKNRPAEGSYDFQFRLYDSNDPCMGTELGSPIDINNLDVIDGHFIVELDFGSGIFDGNAVWLETRVVRSPMGSDPATLSPLLELTPTPYAVYARTAPAGHSLDAADGTPTDSVYVDDNGNVGIGTTNPLSKLSVGGDGIANIGVYGVGSYAGVYGRDGDTGAYGYFGFNTVGVYGGGSDFGVYGGGSDYGVYGYGPGTGVHGLDTISGSYGHIGYDSWGGYFSGDGYFSGNVGIGTTSPSTTLDVAGTVNAIAFVGDGSGLTGIAGDLDWIISGNDMYSAPSGNVGIGTMSPDSDLHVQGYGNREIKVESLDASFPRFTLKNYRGEYRIILSGDLPALGGGNLEFYNGSVVNFVLTKDGNVGVGTTSPSAKLDVNGDMNISSTYKIGGSTVLSAPDTDNTFVGVGAGENNTGSSGTFLGHNAGYNNQGSYNTFLGKEAGYSNTTGSNNTFLGRYAGRSNTTGSMNTISGYYAGYSNTSGHSNTFLGYGAGSSNTTGYHNTFLGLNAGHNNTTGHDNTFLGYYAGSFNTTGYYNTFLGRYAGYNNTEGSENIFSGFMAGFSNTTGRYNTFVGHYAGRFNTTGLYNTFVGREAGYYNTTGRDNTFLGPGAGHSNTTGGENTFSGSYAGYDNTEGSNNTFVGRYAGFSNTTGNNNTFLGRYAGRYNTTGNDNIFLGNYAGYNNTEGGSNTFVGRYAGNSNQTGAGNVFIGYMAGYNETGSNKLYIANSDADPPLIYGDFSTGNVGIGTTSPGSFKLYVNGAAYSTGGWLGSDRRFKENIEKIESPLEKIRSIKGVSFEWKRSDYKEKGFPAGRHFGVIAQEVEQVLPEIVKEGPDGDKAVSYTELVPILTEAIKQQQKQIEDLQQEVAQLKHFVKKEVEWK